MRNASAWLRIVGAAQVDFRVNDRDGNGRNDYWRADIAGLYGVRVEGAEIKLIERSMAAADDRPVVKVGDLAEPSPKAGFFLRALPHADETARGPDRFAACSFPGELEKGRYGTYVISEAGVVRKKILGHARGLEVHPTEGQLKIEAWEWFE